MPDYLQERNICCIFANEMNKGTRGFPCFVNVKH